MTPEQKIIAIAEFEGWKVIDVPFIPNQVSLDDKTCFTRKALAHWKGMAVKQIPSYLTSRDAICGAVARLDENTFDDFVIHLQKVTGSVPLGPNALRKILLATPAQLADALLLTLGYEI